LDSRRVFYFDKFLEIFFKKITKKSIAYFGKLCNFLPREIKNRINLVQLAKNPSPFTTVSAQPDFDKFCVIAEAETANSAKKNSVRTRYKKVFEALRKDDPKKLASIIANRRLTRDIVGDLLISETHLFRQKSDYEDYERLKQEGFDPKNILIMASGATEPYSIAHIFPGARIKAVDMQDFTADFTAGYMPEDAFKRGAGSKFFQDFKAKYFRGEAADRKVKIEDSLAERINFQQSDIFGYRDTMKYDLVICNNVFFYFSAADKKRAFEALKNLTKSGGHLTVGPASTTLEVVKNETEVEKIGRGSSTFKKENTPHRLAPKCDLPTSIRDVKNEARVKIAKKTA